MYFLKNLQLSLRNTKDVMNILNRCEKMVKGVCFEIIVHQLKQGEKQRHLIDIDPEDLHFVSDENENANMETFEQRLDRIENLQGIYIELWDKTTDILEQCKREFKDKDYKIELIKRKSDQISKKVKSFISYDKSDKPYDTYSSASTVDIGDWQSGFSSDSTDTDTSTKRNRKNEYPKISSSSVTIGPNGTEIKRDDYEQLNWGSAAASTRKLLTILFGDKVLATHSLTGNQSPAFRGRERAPKGKLDPIIISDIIYIVTTKCEVNPKVVRGAITTKCADASKKMRHIGMKT